jgi:hypothetical protein
MIRKIVIKIYYQYSIRKELLQYNNIKFISKGSS